MTEPRTRIAGSLLAVSATLLTLACGCLRAPPALRSGAAEVDAVPRASGDSPEAGHDPWVGWYVVSGKDRLIPVFKRAGTYFSVCRGFEIPLQESESGLVWASEPSSMTGTTIGRDPESGAYYLAVYDEQLSHFSDGAYGRGQKEPLTRIDRPAWLPDATAAPPRTLDDFLGWYQPTLLPGFPRWEIRKEGDTYVVLDEARDPASGPALWDRRALTPLPEALGFTGFEKELDLSLTYNAALQRFELEMRDIRMPLTRVAPPRAGESGAAPVPIGIPTWH